MIQRIKKGLVLAMLLFVSIMIFGTETSYAAYTAQETSIALIQEYVGRYKLSYTGNTNHFASWNNSGTAPVGKADYIYNDVSGFTNSSTATLSKTPGANGIKYAFLVWETRAREGAYTPIYCMTPKGGSWVYPTYAINDWRDSGNGSWAYQTMYCMATDVTSIVQRAGYGSYTVCNIPRYNGGTGGGESPGSWQLIVVEEGDDFPVRVVSLAMGSEFRASGLTASKDYSGDLNLTSGLKSKATGAATGQIMFGASNAGNNVALKEQITTYNSSGGYVGQAVANTTYSAGLYRNAQLFNGRDSSTGCIRMDLSDVNNIGNSASRIHLNVENNSWTTFFLLGAALDIAYPDFEGEQVTTVNNSTSATVAGKFTNTAQIQNTGIYNGNLTVNLDSGLTPTSATAVVNGTTTISGTISGNTVTFSGAAVASMMNGSSISYIVQCTTSNSGKTIFNNDAKFHGYLRSDGVNTGYWIDRMWTASSSAEPKYTVTVNYGIGIESVAGGGDYTYGSAVKASAVLKPGYHWQSWTGSYSTSQQDFTFNMPAGDISLTANAEANAYSIIFNPNDGGEVTHLDNIETHYDADVTLPNGADFYQKYTLDGVNVTNEVLSGELALADAGVESETLDDEEAAALAEGEVDTVDAEKARDETVEGTETVETAGSEPIATDESEPKPGNDIGQSNTESEGTEEGALLQAEPAPAKKVYPSVFMGWSLEDGKNSFIPKWKVSDVVKNLTEENNGAITLYAVWDDCPWIQAEDLYYTLEQAQSGYITQEEILSHATASDREDGSPIAPGFHEDGTSFSIPDYSPADFTQFQHEGSSTENLTVVDSTGSVYYKQITVYVVDTTAVAVEPVGTTRFINEYYYNQPYEYGGLADNSIWKTDPEYRAVLQSAFNNIKNDTPERVYEFSHEDMKEMRRFVEENGMGNSKSPDALRRFYDQFMEPNRTK